MSFKAIFWVDFTVRHKDGISLTGNIVLFEGQDWDLETIESYIVENCIQKHSVLRSWKINETCFFEKITKNTLKDDFWLGIESLDLLKNRGDI